MSGSVGVDAFEHGGEITARETPVERTRRRVVALLETLESILERGEVGEAAVGGIRIASQGAVHESGLKQSWLIHW